MCDEQRMHTTKTTTTENADYDLLLICTILYDDAVVDGMSF